MKKDKKIIVQYNHSEKYWILIPVYYENETQPAWRLVFSGTKEECKKEFYSFPDYMIATPEENKRNRENKRKEYLFLLEIGKTAAAAAIKNQYHL